MVLHLLNNINKYEQIKQKYSIYQDTFYTKINKLFYQLSSNFNNDVFEFINKSKNIRSLVLYLISLTNKIKIDDNIINICIITELIHNASLLHDDVVDDCELRRGIYTFNKKYDNKIACLLGDYMLTIAVTEMLNLNYSRINKYYNRAIKHMCIGEIKQYESKYKIISIKEYIQKCIRKTSLLYEAQVYAFCCLYIKNYSKTIRLMKFARYFGIAFQIKDDLNNIINENNKKPKLSDIKNGIYNSNVIYASYDYPNLLKKQEKEYIEIIKREKYTNKSKKLIQKYIKKAKKELKEISNSSYKEDLFTIMDMFML